MVRGRISKIQAKQIEIAGIVQGVGFRPFVFTLAKKYHLGGIVYNTSSGVYIEVEGGEENINNFLKELKDNPPPLAVIDEIEVKDLGIRGYEDFKIISSKEDGGFVPVSPDMGSATTV